MFRRRLAPLATSTLLLGPRGTGKSTWIRQNFPGARSYDLLDTGLALRLLREPGLLHQELTGLPAESWVVIDEVQKVPALLDEVHRLIETRGLRFLLSGSSARKIRRGAANLLAGRALGASLFPLVSAELGKAPPIERVPFGMLPRACKLEQPHRFLKTYCETYIKEEVFAESLTRNTGGFARFLEVAARQNAMVTNVSNIAREAQVARQTVQSFFEILLDTLLGSWLPAWRPRRQTKVVAHPKFYFFDAGVARTLGGRLAYPPTPEELGNLFETYILHELRAYLSYAQLDYPLHYFRTHDDVEADLLFETANGFVAIEIKSSATWRDSYAKGLARLRDELPGIRCLGVFTGAQPLTKEFYEVLPYPMFLERLWAGDLVS